MKSRSKQAQSSPGQVSYPYGLKGIPGLPSWQVEAEAFRLGRTVEQGGLGRFEHLRKWLSLCWPGEVMPHRWNPWTERTLQELCSDEGAHVHGGVRVKTSVLVGCATASKTWTVGMYAFLWWACSPHNSLVVFTSTTKEMIRRRIWPVVQYFHDAARTTTALNEPEPWKGIFNKVESKTTIQYVNPVGTISDKNAIFALAVAHGETQKAAHNLRGMHAERVLLVIDEANGTPEAIFETIPNLRKGCKEFQAVIIGNPVSRLDPHGQCATPATSWASVTENTSRWLTKGVDKWQLESGLCLRFDGKDSPNVATGKDKWPFIYTNSDWHRATNASREKTLAYWSQDRGLWPPDGFCHTVISEAMLEKYDPRDGDPFRWLSKRRLIAALDPAFGGDECKLGFAELGDIEGGKEALQIVATVSLTFESAARDEIDYSIARQTIDECRRRGVAPEDFGLDRTGTGRGVAAIISGEWSSAIHQVEFGEMATERPSSTADGRPSREVYANRVTEMWWSVREFLEASQLRGIESDARIEFCTREYQLRGRKYVLEPKPDLKLRLGRSPDSADMISILVDVARQRGVGAQTRNTTSTNNVWDRMLEKQVQASEQDAQELEGTVPGQFRPASVMDMFEEAVEAGWD